MPASSSVARAAPAHLGLVLDITANPPFVAYARVFDTLTPAVGHGRRLVVLHSEIAPTYREAYDKVETVVENDPQWAWVLPLMRWSTLFGRRAKPAPAKLFPSRISRPRAR